MDRNFLLSKPASFSLVGMSNLGAIGAAQLKSGAFYSLLFTALVMEKLGEKALKLKEQVKRLSLAPIVEGSSSDDTSQGCAEATPSGQGLKPADIDVKASSSTKEVRGKYRPLSREEALAIRAKYNDGQSVFKIAKEFGISRWACYKIINFRSHVDKWEG